MHPCISIRGFVRPSVGPLVRWSVRWSVGWSVGPWWSSWEWWKCIESWKYLRLLHHSTRLMQYCIILNKLSRMWTHRCTPEVLVSLNSFVFDYLHISNRQASFVSPRRTVNGPNGDSHRQSYWRHSDFVVDEAARQHLQDFQFPVESLLQRRF